MATNGSATGAASVVDASTPTKIAEAANKIYQENFQETYEISHKGKYVAIDIRSGLAHLGDSSDDALEKARKDAPHGVFHLIRVGSPAAFKATRFTEHQDDWLWNAS